MSQGGRYWRFWNGLTQARSVCRSRSASPGRGRGSWRREDERWRARSYHEARRYSRDRDTRSRERRRSVDRQRSRRRSPDPRRYSETRRRASTRPRCATPGTPENPHTEHVACFGGEIPPHKAHYIGAFLALADNVRLKLQALCLSVAVSTSCSAVKSSNSTTAAGVYFCR